MILPKYGWSQPKMTLCNKFLLSLSLSLSLSVSLQMICLLVMCGPVSVFSRAPKITEDLAEAKAPEDLVETNVLKVGTEVTNPARDKTSSFWAFPGAQHAPFCAQPFYSTFPKYNLLRLQLTVSHQPN